MAAPITAQRYQGRPCRACGATERYVSTGACCECMANHNHVKRHGYTKPKRYEQKPQPEAKRPIAIVVVASIGPSFIQPPSLARLMAGR